MYRFLECHYKRSADADSELVAGHTAIFVPSMVDIMPTDEEWEATKVKYTAAMEAALAKPEEDQKIAQQESDEKFHKEQAEKKAAKEEAKAQRMAEKEKLAEERRKKAAELEAKKEESEQKVVDGEDKAEKEAEKEADNEDAPAAEDKPEEEQMVRARGVSGPEGWVSPMGSILTGEISLTILRCYWLKKYIKSQIWDWSEYGLNVVVFCEYKNIIGDRSPTLKTD